MKTVEEYLEVALGGNMNIATLKLKAWHEIMNDYAKYYHKNQSDKNAVEDGMTMLEWKHFYQWVYEKGKEHKLTLKEYKAVILKGIQQKDRYTFIEDLKPNARK